MALNLDSARGFDYQGIVVFGYIEEENGWLDCVSHIAHIIGWAYWMVAMTRHYFTGKLSSIGYKSKRHLPERSSTEYMPPVHSFLVILVQVSLGWCLRWHMVSWGYDPANSKGIMFIVELLYIKCILHKYFNSDTMTGQGCWHLVVVSHVVLCSFTSSQQHMFIHP